MHVLGLVLLSIIFMVLGSLGYRVDLGSDSIKLLINRTWTRQQEWQQRTKSSAADNRTHYSHRYEDLRQSTEFSAADKRSHDAVLQQITNRSGNRSNGSLEVARNASAVANGSLGVSGSKVKNESSIIRAPLSKKIVRDFDVQILPTLRDYAINPSDTEDFFDDFKDLITEAATWLNQYENAEKMRQVAMKDLKTLGSKLEVPAVEVELDVPLRYQDATSLGHETGEHNLDVWLWHATTRSAYRGIMEKKQMLPGSAYGSMTGGIYMASSPAHAIRKARNAFTTSGNVGGDQDMVFAAPVYLGEVFRVGEESPNGKEVFPDKYSLFWEFAPNNKSKWQKLNGAEWLIGNPKQIKVSQSIPFVFATEWVAPVLTNLVQLANQERTDFAAAAAAEACGKGKQCCYCTTRSFMNNVYKQLEKQYTHKGQCCKKQAEGEPSCQPERCLKVFAGLRAGWYTCSMSHDCR